MESWNAQMDTGVLGLKYYLCPVLAVEPWIIDLIF